ncbi:MAG: hypothetical protein AAB436_01220 [Patescibacteria group bacterium]
MANKVYDPQSDERRAPLRQPSESEAVNPEELRDAEENGGNDSSYNPDGDSGAKSESANGLKNAEKSGGKSSGSSGSSSGGNDGLYNPKGDAPQGRLAGTRNRLQGARAQFKRLGSNKWLLGGTAGATAGLVALLILFVMFIGSLKIPHLVENSMVYQFARVTRQMSLNSRNITSEKLAIDAADDRVWSKIKDKYGSGTGKAKDLHEKLTNKFSPAKIAANYDEGGHFKPIYDDGKVFRGPRLVAVQLDNVSYKVDSPTGLGKYIPGVRTVYAANSAKEIAPYLNESMKLDGIGPLVRGRVMNQMRQQLGIGLVAWKVGKYQGLTPDEAKLQQARDFNTAVAKDEVTQAKTTDLKTAADESDKTLKEDIKDDKKLATIMKNRGVDPNVVSTVEKYVTSGGGIVRGIVSFISPVYSVALPVCLIYDGSLQSNGPNMDAQQNQLRRTANYANTMAGQQKHGFDAETGGVGAANEQFGDIASSTALVRASGGKVDTSSYQSAQASPSGDYTIFDATFGSGSTEVADSVNFIADNTCGIFTNVYAGIGLGIVSLGGCFIAPEGCLGAKAVEEGANKFLGRLGGKIVEKIASEQKSQKATALGGIIQDGVKSGGKTVLAVGGATLLARSIVYSHANQAHTGLQQGKDLADDVDNGNNLDGSAVMQRGFFGRPLTDKESAQSARTDREALVRQTQSQNAFERYASINNAQSLVSRLGLMSSHYTTGTMPSSLFSSLASLLRPLNSIGSMFGSLFTTPALADNGNTSANTNYGNVLWGFSDSELALIKGDPSYKPLENQRILDDNIGKEDAIGVKYGGCFDGQKGVGSMLAEGEIVRDANGDVVRGSGLCSPDNLSFKSPDDLAIDSSPDTTHSRDLIFRYRVAHGYETSLDQLITQQTVTE